jgi:hypothetical protein
VTREVEETTAEEDTPEGEVQRQSSIDYSCTVENPSGTRVRPRASSRGAEEVAKENSERSGGRSAKTVGALSRKETASEVAAEQQCGSEKGARRRVGWQEREE